jgi:site-specific recombinase XerD
MQVPTTDVDDVTVVTDANSAHLNERQQIDYENHKRQLIDWLLNVGKDPEAAEGYALDTIRRRSVDVDRFYRWVWDRDDGYTTNVSPDDADEYAEELAYADYANSYKRNIQASLLSLFDWQARTRGGDEWDPEYSFSTSGLAAQPRDYFSKDERRRLREAALEYGSVPHYNSLSPSKRREWKRHLAKRFKKPMDDIGKADFERANGFKYPSLVHASLDAGLRPVEVQRARTSWVDVENAVLRIPHDDSAKSELSWTVTLRDQTADFLARWLDERQHYAKYDDTDCLWLTRESNPYSSSALSYVLDNLCEIAGITTETRDLSWYAIRHSLGTAMADERGLAAAQSQLRHVSPQTTLKYDNVSHDQRRDALDKIG